MMQQLKVETNYLSILSTIKRHKINKNFERGGDLMEKHKKTLINKVK
jgi:hypothetical protein